MEWIQYTFTPFASWGVMAYSQSNSINIMQFVSVFGMAGLSFLIYWVNVSMTQLITKKKANLLSLYLPLSILIIVIISIMLNINYKKDYICKIYFVL